MKYKQLIFSEKSGFYIWNTDRLNNYTKNKLFSSLGKFHMYIDSDKLETSKEKFKKDLLKHYNNIIKEIEQI